MPTKPVVGGEPPLDMGWTTAYLREWLAKTPPAGYTAWGEQ
ncbi:hypothetical protein [Streptomyces sp. NPDC002851]